MGVGQQKDDVRSSECSVDGCDRAVTARGLCNMHYLRVRKTGTADSRQPRFTDAEEAFAFRTERRGECLIWTGSKNDRGYGQITVNGKRVKAHRYAWERAHGKLPAGVLVDHRDHCDPACVEVTHLRVATKAENNQNRNGGNQGSKTGVRNVKPNGKGFQVNVRDQYLGTFETVEEAAQVAEVARKQMFKDYAGRGTRK